MDQFYHASLLVPVSVSYQCSINYIAKCVEMKN